MLLLTTINSSYMEPLPWRRLVQLSFNMAFMCWLILHYKPLLTMFPMFTPLSQINVTYGTNIWGILLKTLCIALIKKFLWLMFPNPPTYVMFVYMLNKNDFIFLTALLLLNIVLNLFIWIFWVLFLNPLCFVIAIFLLLLMIIVAFVGFSWWNTNVNHII